MKTFILTANASVAHLYSTENLHTDHMKELKTLTHPKSRSKGIDLNADRSGHFKTSHDARSAYEKSDPKQVEAEKFAIELSKELNVDRNLNEYDKVMIIAPAHFYGLIKKHLDKHVPEMMHLDKDYTQLDIVELAKRIREHLLPPK